MRAEAGLTEKYLLLNTQAPNEIVVLFEAEDIDRARAFAESADLREKMQALRRDRQAGHLLPQSLARRSARDLGVSARLSVCVKYRLGDRPSVVTATSHCRGRR